MLNGNKPVPSPICPSLLSMFFFFFLFFSSNFPFSIMPQEYPKIYPVLPASTRNESEVSTAYLR